MSLRNLADTFALKITAGEYAAAFEMLSKSAQEIWSPESLRESFEGMYADIQLAQPRVITGWNDDSGTTELRQGTMLYVPIESADPWSEAIIVIIDQSKEIIEVEFGRP